MPTTQITIESGWMSEIIGKGYNSNFKRHIREALFIKARKPNLNVQKYAYRLNLYNGSSQK